MVKAVIFDMDGVLADSEPLHVGAESSVLGRKGVSLTEEELAKYKGTTENFFWNDVVKRHRIQSDYFDLINEKREIFFKAAETIKPFEGVMSTLKDMKSKGIPIALASGSDRAIIDFILMKLDIKDYFDVIVSGEDVLCGKPSPDIFVEAALRLSVDAHDCIVIEDSINGVLAAKSAKMHCVAVTNTFRREELSDADLIVDSLKELDVDKIKRM